MRVEVYFNLHKNIFSLRQKGKVIAYKEKFFLKNCTFVVQPAGNKKVRATKQKNVHAFIRGELCEEKDFEEVKSNNFRVTYDPYKYTNFVLKNTEEPIFNCQVAKLYLTQEGKPNVVVKA